MRYLQTKKYIVKYKYFSPIKLTTRKSTNLHPGHKDIQTVQSRYRNWSIKSKPTLSTNPKIFGQTKSPPEDTAGAELPADNNPTETANAMATAKVLTELHTITQNLAAATGTTGTCTAASNQTNTGAANCNTRYRRNPLLLAQGLDGEGIPIMYCWSHSTTRNLNHTSATCSHKKEGHKDNATIQNKMGHCTGGSFCLLFSFPFSFKPT